MPHIDKSMGDLFSLDDNPVLRSILNKASLESSSSKHISVILIRINDKL